MNGKARTRALLALIIVLLPPLLWWLFSRPVPTTVQVYFVKGTEAEGTLAPVPRVVRARGDAAKITQAFRELLAGPTDAERAQGITTEIPAGTRLRGVAVTGGIVVADFSADLERGGGSASMQARVWQIVYTGTQFPATASQVLILIEGARRQALGGEGIIIKDPIPRSQQIPTF